MYIKSTTHCSIFSTIPLWGYSLIFGFTFLYILDVSSVHATVTATASSGGWFSRRSDTQTDVWRTTNPFSAAAASVVWTDGPYDADGLPLAAVTIKEPKFGPGMPPTPTTYTGFVTIHNGPGGSVASGQGTGSGTIPGLLFVSTATVTVSGSLGTGPPGPSYDSQAKVDADWPVANEYLSDLPGSFFDVYIPLGIEGGTTGMTGGTIISRTMQFSVDYETSDGISNLLRIDISGVNATATTGLPASTSFYSLPSIDADSAVFQDSPVSLSEIAATLETDLADLSIDTPIYLGVLLDDVPIPEEGEDAVIHVAWSVAESAAIPEPSTIIIWTLLGILGLAIGFRRR